MMHQRKRHRQVELLPYQEVFHGYTLGGWYPHPYTKIDYAARWRVSVCYLDIPEQGTRAGYTVVGLAFAHPGWPFDRKRGQAMARGRARQCLADIMQGHPAIPCIRQPLLVGALETASWRPHVLRHAFLAPAGFRLPTPKRIPLSRSIYL